MVSLAVAAATVTALLFATGEWTWASGADDAREDIRRGHLELRSFGKPASWAPEYARLLDSRLGVRFEMLGCSVSGGLVRHTSEYDKVIAQEIERCHGAGILNRLADEAMRTVPATRPAA